HKISFLSLTSDNLLQHSSFPTRRSSDLSRTICKPGYYLGGKSTGWRRGPVSPDSIQRDGRQITWSNDTHIPRSHRDHARAKSGRSEEHTSELQSRFDIVCRLLLEKKKKQ